MTIKPKHEPREELRDRLWREEQLKTSKIELLRVCEELLELFSGDGEWTDDQLDARIAEIRKAVARVRVRS